MNRKRRLFAAVIVIVLIAIGVEILIESIAADGLLRFVESRLAAETDLEVRFGDDFHLEILPVLRFEANSVTVTDILAVRPGVRLICDGYQISGCLTLPSRSRCTSTSQLLMSAVIESLA